MKKKFGKEQKKMLKMWRIFAICFNLVFATTDYECPSAIPTLSAVKRCPGNRTEWIQASNQKKCSFIKQNCSSESDFQYHCLLNQKADGFVEVCLPVRLIVGHFCPFYDSEKARVDNHYTIPCQDHKVNCPQHYRSNEAYK
ncbi:uncharacterized protein LOC134261882, partial [Saccostrea cucullata]|uniref:uncharacterized protein LOC134261882 n=1 Tax=Saccostrea cuccullata TaxID=36930 RepID=UPI002ECFEA7A